MKSLREQAVQGVKPGDSWSFSRTFTQKDDLAFGAITKDYNPVHYEDRFVKAKNLDGRICHGLLTASMISQLGGQLAWLASSMQFDFIKPVYFGDTITCHMELKEIDDRGLGRVAAEFFNQNNACVLRADLKGILPNQEEKKILQSMLEEGDPTNKLRD